MFIIHDDDIRYCDPSIIMLSYYILKFTALILNPELFVSSTQILPELGTKQEGTIPH